MTGYRLITARAEFWKGRESRLHDRIVYERINASGSLKDPNAWKQYRIQP